MFRNIFMFFEKKNYWLNYYLEILSYEANKQINKMDIAFKNITMSFFDLKKKKKVNATLSSGMRLISYIPFINE